MSLSLVSFGLSIVALLVVARDRQVAGFIYNYLLFIISLFIVPFFYLFLCQLTNSRGINRRNRLALAPSFIYFFLVSIVALIMGHRNVVLYSEAISQTPFISFLPGNIWYNINIGLYYSFFALFLIQVVVLILVGIRKIRRFEFRCRNYFQGRSFSPRTYTWSFLIFFASSVVFYIILGILLLVDYPWVLLSMIFMLTISQFLLGYITYSLSFTADELNRLQRHDQIYEDVRNQVTSNR